MPPEDPQQPASENLGQYRTVYTSSRDAQSGIPQIVIQQAAVTSSWTRILTRILTVVLIVSLLLNVSLLSDSSMLMSDMTGPVEKHFRGDRSASDKIAVLKIDTTIMPPYTEKIFDVIKKIDEDDSVKAVILQVDSPGGLVADSHEIYHKLKALAAKKPIYASMRRLAASGGYYVAMGVGEKGKIFAEPTTWTGSIGVIIPRYDISELASTYGIKSDPLTTGKFKDALSPFKSLTEDERGVWKEILDDAYNRFVGVIVENRTQLTRDQVLDVATGQIFTANQALEKGLVDQIGFIDDVITALRNDHDLESARVVEYEFTPTISQLLFGQASFKAPPTMLETIMEQSVPRAMYLFSWQERR